VGLNTLFVVVECNDDPDYYKSLSKYGEGSIIESHFSPYTVPNGSTSGAAVAFKNSYQKKWGGLPGMMGATTYEGVYIIANAVGQAGSLDKTKIKDALTATNMPESIEAMKDGKITFSKDAREAAFNLYMEQLAWNETLQALRPTIIYPAGLSQGSFVLPDWYQPGKA
jgi:branched-chain amino acid transport system substrate-binding protein